MTAPSCGTWWSGICKVQEPVLDMTTRAGNRPYPGLLPPLWRRHPPAHAGKGGARVHTRRPLVRRAESADSSPIERGVGRLEDQGREGRSSIGLSCCAAHHFASEIKNAVAVF